MKRILAVAFIVCYVSLLTCGNACHLLQYGANSHVMMYMIVWDMFCGYSAYDAKVHFIAEGESETYYDVTSPPWGEIHAFGYLGRENYDPFDAHTPALALNVLKHTTHEPITRILVIEEAWPKKLNLPDEVWNLRYDNPKEHHRYYRLRDVILPDGRVVEKYESYMTSQLRRMSLDNPRLVQQSVAGRPMFVNDGQTSTGSGRLSGLPTVTTPISGPSAH